MKINSSGIELIKEFESVELKAYKCPAGIWTIGYGNTFYEDKTPVKNGDVITFDTARSLFNGILSEFETKVKTLVKSNLNDNQFSALVSFAYNCGVGNLKSSTLLKKVNFNPLDPAIKDEFLKWNKSNGKVLNGLTSRRNAEAKLYFS